MGQIILRDEPLNVIGNAGVDAPIKPGADELSAVTSGGGMSAGDFYAIPIQKGRADKVSLSWGWDAAIVVGSMAIWATDAPEYVAPLSDILTSPNQWWRDLGISFSGKFPTAAGALGCDGDIIDNTVPGRMILLVEVTTDGRFGVFMRALST